MPRDIPEGRRCVATSNRTGEQCGQVAIRGGTVCQSHGGSTKHVKRKALERLATAEAVKTLGTYGRPVTDADPVAAVLDEIAHTWGHVRWLREQVEESTPEALTWGLTGETSKEATEFPGVDRSWAAVPSVWLKLYMAEREKLVKVCEVAHRMGIEERRVHVAEELGGLIVQAIRRLLSDLDLTEAQQETAAAVVPLRLRQLTSAMSGAA